MCVCRLDCHFYGSMPSSRRIGCHLPPLRCSHIAEPTCQFSATIVILCEGNRTAHIIRERPDHLCGWLGLAPNKAHVSPQPLDVCASRVLAALLLHAVLLINYTRIWRFNADRQRTAYDAVEPASRPFQRIERTIKNLLASRTARGSRKV